MIRVPTDRVPTHPGEMLQEEFLLPANLTIQELSAAIYVSELEMQALVEQHRSLTPSLALRLAKYFGTSADFWMNLQLRWDFYHAGNAEAAILSNIRPRST